MIRYKIAIFLPYLESKGGVNVSVKTIAEYLRDKGHEVHLFPVGITKYDETAYTHPINSNNNSERKKIVQKLFLHLEEKKKFDVIITNSKPTTKLVNILNAPNKQLIILRQSSFIRKHFLARLSYRLSYKKYYNGRHVAAITNCLKESFMQRFTYLSPKSVSVLYNSFNGTEILNAAQEKKHMKLSKPYIISVGRLSKNKNTIKLLQAFNSLQNKNIHLVILGDGKEKKNLEGYVLKKHLEKRVHFLGWKENPYPYIKNAQLLVHTSKYETFGRVLLEALALKTPVVTFDIKCGPSEILTGKLSKFLVHYNEHNLLTLTIDKALHSYPKIENDLIEKFKIDKIGEQYLQVIKTIVDDNHNKIK